MKFLLCVIFFTSPSVFCSEIKKPQVMVYKKSFNQIRKQDGPPLFVSDIYTDGKPDKNREQLLSNLQKKFPILTVIEIDACINYCHGLNENADIIQECQELQLWKAAHLEDINTVDRMYHSCFPEFCMRRD